MAALRKMGDGKEAGRGTAKAADWPPLLLMETRLLAPTGPKETFPQGVILMASPETVIRTSGLFPLMNS